MYQPRHFIESDESALSALMSRFPLAAIVRSRPDGLAADHVPLHWDAQRRCLRGHVARANPLWREAQAAAQGDLPVLALFRAEQAYISPGWYPSKAETHQVVPTWNYAVVHAHGRLRAVDDAAWLHTLLTDLTTQHEATQRQPWSLADAPADYLAKMMGAVVGIEIAVERLEGKSKLSQNRSATDRDGVVQGLGSRDDPGSQALAARMARQGAAG